MRHQHSSNTKYLSMSIKVCISAKVTFILVVWYGYDDLSITNFLNNVSSTVYPLLLYQCDHQMIIVYIRRECKQGWKISL